MFADSCSLEGQRYTSWVGLMLRDRRSIVAVQAMVAAGGSR